MWQHNAAANALHDGSCTERLGPGRGRTILKKDCCRAILAATLFTNAIQDPVSGRRSPRMETGAQSVAVPSSVLSVLEFGGADWANS